MTEYKVIVKEVTSVVWRDVNKAADGLTEEVASHIASGWEPQGGVASVEAGSTVYLLQALIKRR
jgi:hypothetical protein